MESHAVKYTCNFLSSFFFILSFFHYFFQSLIVFYFYFFFKNKFHLDTGLWNINNPVGTVKDINLGRGESIPRVFDSAKNRCQEDSGFRMGLGVRLRDGIPAFIVRDVEEV